MRIELITTTVIREIVLLMVSLTLCGCHKTSSVTAPGPTTTAAADHSRWMENNIATLGARTLGQLVLPASHDSAMYVTGFPQSLARTQDLSILGQLSAGVRWFDLRPQFNDGKFAMVHGPVTGPKLSTVLADVQRFMTDGHRELVLLKFSHYDSFTAEGYRKFTRQITQSLGNWMFSSTPPGKRLVDITLGEYLQRSGKVIVLCDGHYPVQIPSPGIWVYRDWDSGDPERGDLRVYDQYSNVMTLAAMRSDQLNKFNTFNGACRARPNVPCDLFLLS